MDQATRQKLRKHRVFEGLDDAQFNALVSAGREVVLAQGAVIFDQDDDPDATYFLLSGRVAVQLKPLLAGQTPINVAILEAGDSVGELALIDPSPRSAACRAIEPISVLRLPNPDLEGVMQASPEIGYRFMRNLASIVARRQRRSTEKLRAALSDLFYQ